MRIFCHLTLSGAQTQKKLLLVEPACFRSHHADFALELPVAGTDNAYGYSTTMQSEKTGAGTTVHSVQREVVGSSAFS